MATELRDRGHESRLNEEMFQSLATSIRGPVLRPHDSLYDEVRRVQNGLIDRRPAAIVRCSGPADVIEAVNFARDHGLEVAIRAGGHNAAGNAVTEGGLMIDLSLMRGVRVDPVSRRVRVQGGATWGDVDRETQVFGLATTGGNISTTGVAGLTLHGGMGNLRRKYGLSIDNLVSVDIVTADGQLRTASATENEDLFWAVRGAGSNFGVVTSLEFRLHPVGPLIAVTAPFYPAEDLPGVLRAWRDFMATAPEEISSLVGLWNVPAMEPFPEDFHGKPAVMVVAVYAGSVEEGQAATQPLRELAKPLFDLSGPMPYVVAQSAFDPIYPKGSLYYWKSLYIDHLADPVIDRLHNLTAERPSPNTLIAVWHHGGAVSRVGPEETAFGRRDAPFLVSFDTTWTDPETTDQHIEWTRNAWASMKSFSSDGSVYLNFAGFGEEKAALVRAAYGSKNYDRLVALKNKYDPTNLFRLNQNIKPS